MNGGPSEQAGEARALWDDKNLYLAFDLADKDVWGAFQKHDDKLWTQEAAEVFIDADGDGKTYIELQVSPRNVTFDSWLPAYRQNDNAWDAPGLRTAVQVRGTLDKRDDTDQGWTVEMAIPLAAAKGRLADMKGVPPVPGTEWRVNFFRMDLPGGKPQSASAWSPPLVPDFHAVDKFGTLVFGDELGNPPLKVDTVMARPVGNGPHPLNPITRKLMLANPGQSPAQPMGPVPSSRGEGGPRPNPGKVPPPEAGQSLPPAQPEGKAAPRGAPKAEKRPAAPKAEKKPAGTPADQPVEKK
jgi:hypothetical protein